MYKPNSYSPGIELFKEQIYIAFTQSAGEYAQDNDSIMPADVIKQPIQRPGMSPDEIRQLILSQQNYVTVRPSKKFMGSKEPSRVLGYINDALVNSVYDLSDLHRAWIIHTYTNINDWNNEESINMAMWNAFISQLDKKFKSKKIKIFQGLGYLCFQNVCSDCRYKKQPHKIGRIQELLKISANNWRRDWLPYYRKFESILREYDDQSLNQLLSLYGEKKGN